MPDTVVLDAPGQSAPAETPGTPASSSAPVESGLQPTAPVVSTDKPADAPAASVPAAAPPEKPAAKVYTEDELASWTHDDFKKYPGYNKELKRAIDREINTSRQKQADLQHLSDWHNAFSTLTAEQREAVRGNEQAARQFTNGQTGAQDIDRVFRTLYPHGYNPSRPDGLHDIAGQDLAAHVLADRVYTMLREHPQIKAWVDEDIPVDGDTPADKMASFITGLVERGIADERKGIKNEISKAVQARVTDLVAKYGLQIDEPDVISGTEIKGPDHDAILNSSSATLDQRRAAFRGKFGFEAPSY